jgi:succinate dehydrogenase / fumarate reductase cytochrome b subunit
MAGRYHFLVGNFIRFARSSLWSSSVGTKAVVALSGLPLFGWVLLHAFNNLTLFSGPAVADGHAASLRALGPLLWLVRAGVLALTVIHIAAIVALARRARAARPVGYAVVRPRAATIASRSMRLGGGLLAAFVIFHLLHLTFGALHPAFASGRVYANVVAGLRSPGVVVVYLLAAVLLGLHLFHGLWSASRSLGLRWRSARTLGRPVVALIAAAVTLAFASVPLAVVSGVLR